jgi:hypothetical protein
MVINYCSNVAMKFTRVGQISKFLSPDAVSSSQLTRESLAVCIPNTGEIATRTDCERSLVSKRSPLPCPWQVWCGLDKDIGKDSITDKDIKEVTSLLENPTTVLPSKENANRVLNIIGNIAEGNLEFRESFSHLRLTRALSLMMFAVDPQLQSFCHGHHGFSTVKLKVYTNGIICMDLSDPSGHSVIPIPYQNHGESVTECSLLEHVLESPHFSLNLLI